MRQQPSLEERLMQLLIQVTVVGMLLSTFAWVFEPLFVTALSGQSLTVAFNEFTRTAMTFIGVLMKAGAVIVGIIVLAIVAHPVAGLLEAYYYELNPPPTDIDIAKESFMDGQMTIAQLEGVVEENYEPDEELVDEELEALLERDSQ